VHPRQAAAEIVDNPARVLKPRVRDESGSFRDAEWEPTPRSHRPEHSPRWRSPHGDDMAEHAQLILLWGANLASQPTTTPRIAAARRRGAQIVVIDVRASEALGSCRWTRRVVSIIRDSLTRRTDAGLDQ